MRLTPNVILKPDNFLNVGKKCGHFPNLFYSCFGLYCISNNELTIILIESTVSFARQKLNTFFQSTLFDRKQSLLNFHPENLFQELIRKLFLKQQTFLAELFWTLNFCCELKVRPEIIKKFLIELLLHFSAMSCNWNGPGANPISKKFNL